MAQKSDFDSKAAHRALSDIEGVQRRSSALRFYAAAGGDMFVWGVVWLVANLLSFARPDLSPAAWITGIIIGALVSSSSDYRSPSSVEKKLSLKQSAALFVIIAIALTAIFTIIGIKSRLETNALISTLVALGYCMAGIWKGVRMLIIGLAIGVAVMIGWILLREWFEVWMGIVGGSLLMLSGIWLRKA